MQKGRRTETSLQLALARRYHYCQSWAVGTGRNWLKVVWRLDCYRAFLILVTMIWARTHEGFDDEWNPSTATLVDGKVHRLVPTLDAQMRLDGLETYWLFLHH